MRPSPRKLQELLIEIGKLRLYALKFIRSLSLGDG
jgi:hypothetical protein